MPTNTVPSPLPGSERALRFGSRLIGPANPLDSFEVTVRVRPRGKKIPAAEEIGARMPLKRTYLRPGGIRRRLRSGPGGHRRGRIICREKWIEGGFDQSGRAKRQAFRHGQVVQRRISGQIDAVQPSGRRLSRAHREHSPSAECRLGCAGCVWTGQSPAGAAAHRPEQAARKMRNSPPGRLSPPPR